MNAASATITTTSEAWAAVRAGTVQPGTIRVRADGVTNTGELGYLTGAVRMWGRSGNLRVEIQLDSGAFKWVGHFELAD